MHDIFSFFYAQTQNFAKNGETFEQTLVYKSYSSIYNYVCNDIRNFANNDYKNYIKFIANDDDWQVLSGYLRPLGVGSSEGINYAGAGVMPVSG